MSSLAQENECAMVHLDDMTVLLLCSAFFYVLTSICVVGMILRPLLASAISGLVDLARLAIGRPSEP